MQKKFPDNNDKQYFISDLLDLKHESVTSWTDKDLEMILEHQLSSLIIPDILQSIEDGQLFANDTCLEGLEKNIVYKDVLFGELKNFQVLCFIKDYFKLCIRNDEGIPRDVAQIIYVLSILCGKVEYQKNISRLSDSKVIAEARRILTYLWVPDKVRTALGHLVQEYLSVG